MIHSNKIRLYFEKELQKLAKLRKQAEKSLRNSPEGTLVVSKSNGVIQFFHKKEKSDKKGQYINKKNQNLIAALSQKEYDMNILKEIEKQEKRIDRALDLIPNHELEVVYEKLTDAKKVYVKPYVLNDEEYIKAWLSVPYEGKQYKDNLPKFETERGEMVRSKSEKIIADKMHRMGIPYRYEYPVYTKEWGNVYPDFTILKVSSREEVIFEHFGMMDDPEYSNKNLRKIQILARNGYILGKNFLAAFESSEVPLDVKQVEKMLEELR